MLLDGGGVTAPVNGDRSIVVRMREQECDTLAHIEDDFRNGDFNMEPTFVRIGTRVLNLSNVAEMAYSSSLGASGTLRGIVITCVGDTSVVIYDDEAAYRDVSEWMARQPSFVFAK